MGFTYALVAGMLLTANLTPDVGPGMWLGGELGVGPLSIGLDVRVVLPAAVDVGPFNRDLSQYVLLLLPCGKFSFFFGCAVAGAGPQLTYDSDGRSASSSHVVPILELGGRIGGQVPLIPKRFALRAWAELLYNAPRAVYKELLGEEVQFQSQRPDLSAFFGVGGVITLGD